MKSTLFVEYYVQPPNVPEYLYKYSSEAWMELMRWSYREYNERLKQNARKGYVREVKKTAEESPLLILATMSGFRRLCSKMSNETWGTLERQPQDYMIKAFKLHSLLFE